MSEVVREVEEADREQAFALGRLAFGGDRDAQPTPPPAGSRSWGVFDEGRLVAKAAVRPYGQWWGGREVGMGGLAGVAVAPEARGRGSLRRLVTEALLPEMAADRLAISVLYPTAPGIYRGLGWEVVGALDEVRLPTVALQRARGGPPLVAVPPAEAEVPMEGRAGDGSRAAGPGPGASADEVVVRTASGDDAAAVHRLYTEHAASTAGLLTRTGPSFPRGAATLLEHDVVALAEQDGRPEGYLAYERGRGYGEGAALHAWEMVARTPGAAAALVRSLGSWDSVAPAVRWRGPVDDLERALGNTVPPPVDRRPWMLRVLDAPRAVAERGYDPAVRVDAGLVLVDPQVPEQGGAWRLRVEDGRGVLERTDGRDLPRLHVRGLALLWAGLGTSAALRAGLLDRPVPGLDAALSGPAPRLLDYF